MSDDNNIYVINSEIFLEVVESDEIAIIPDYVSIADYDYVQNKPLINGKLVDGNKSGTYYGLVNVSEMDLKENVSNKINSLSVDNTDTQYCSAKCIYSNLIKKTDVDLSNLSEDGQKIINNKANVDLSNLSTTGQAKFNAKVDLDLSNLSATGQSIIDNKANVDLSNLSTTGQSIIDNKANVDLSNLSVTGQSIIDNKANVDLSNLSTTGQAKFNAKVDLDLSNLSAAGQSIIDNKANVDLSNLSTTGQAKFNTKADLDLSNLSAAGQSIIDNKANVDLSNLSETGLSKFNTKANITDVLLKTDKKEIATWGMPSDKIVTLTLGASGTQYTAPANGYFACLLTIAAGSVNFYNKTVPYGVIGSMFAANAGIYKGYVPARKGDVVVLQYPAASSMTYKDLYFIYAQGEVE